MPVDTKQIMDEAEKLGQLVAQHPAVERYKQAQKVVAEDAEAGRLLAEFDRQLETLARQEQSGNYFQCGRSRQAAVVNTR